MKLGQIQDVKVKMEVVLGGAEYTVAEVAGIGEGTIIELNTLAAAVSAALAQPRV